VDYSERTYLDSDPLVTSSGTTIASESLPQESETESCPKPQSSLTCVSSYSPVQPSSTEELRTWLLRASPANRFPLQESEPEQTTNETCGPQPSMSFAVYDQDTHCWRTCRVSFLPDTSELFSETWPKAGLMRDGMCYRQRRLLTKKMAHGCGSWFRPVARDWKGYTNRAGESICNQLKTLFSDTSGKPHPEFIEEVMGWPIGWSALEPLEMGRFRQWCEQHGSY
jgi:hypothetical protein